MAMALIKKTKSCSYCSKLKKKKKVAQQNDTVDVQCKNTGCIVQKHCTCIHAFVYKKKEHKLMIKKKKYILNKPKVL